MKNKKIDGKANREDLLEKEISEVVEQVKKETNTVEFYKIAELVAYVAAVLTFGVGIFDTINGEGLGPMNFALAALWAIVGYLIRTYIIKANKTNDYYNAHAEEFVKATENADMSEARNRFLAYIPDGGRILDWGCGSGRDTLAFKEEGYEVEAVDASKELCRLASEKTGIEVKCEKFDQLDCKESYDGIWACASLLHAPEYAHIEKYILRAQIALKQDGVLYMSFKYGDFEGHRDGRYFVDMTENRMNKLLKGKRKIQIKEEWISTDVREGREGQQWYNVIIQKI